MRLSHMRDLPWARKCVTIRRMGKTPTYISVLEFFETAPIMEAEHLHHYCHVIIKARKAKSEIRQQRARAAEGGSWTSWSIAEMAEQILIDAGKPMNARELEESIKERFGRHHSRQSVIGAVSRMTKAGVTFYRSEKGRYGLQEWATGPAGVTPDDPVSEHAADE